MNAVNVNSAGTSLPNHSFENGPNTASIDDHNYCNADRNNCCNSCKASYDFTPLALNLSQLEKEIAPQELGDQIIVTVRKIILFIALKFATVVEVFARLSGFEKLEMRAQVAKLDWKRQEQACVFEPLLHELKNQQLSHELASMQSVRLCCLWFKKATESYCEDPLALKRMKNAIEGDAIHNPSICYREFVNDFSRKGIAATVVLNGQVLNTVLSGLDKSVEQASTLFNTITGSANSRWLPVLQAFCNQRLARCCEETWLDQLGPIIEKQVTSPALQGFPHVKMIPTHCYRSTVLDITSKNGCIEQVNVTYKGSYRPVIKWDGNSTVKKVRRVVPARVESQIVFTVCLTPAYKFVVEQGQTFHRWIDK